MATNPHTLAIRQFIIENVEKHPTDIVRVAGERFRISRQALNRHMTALEEEGVLISEGRTRSRRYKLRSDRVFKVLKVAGLQEDQPWNELVKPKLAAAPHNVLEVCDYGFTEILNNVIDHSGSDYVTIDCSINPVSISFSIGDQGIGIFRKIQNEFRLASELEALTELAKGKLTTDPKRHTGEGIFFTSRMFDCFSILSGELYFFHKRPDNDWIVEDVDERKNGTTVTMDLATNSPTKMKDVFDKYAQPNSDDEYAFSKTLIPVCLMSHGNENIVSRSQAKRLLSRFEQFRHVVLDFRKVESIGQAFADEIFRVYQNEHPEIAIEPINMNKAVQDMVRRAQARRTSE